MFKYILPVAVVVALAAATLTSSAAIASGPGSGGGGGSTETRVEGTVTSVNATAGTLVITTQGGTAVTVTTTSSTKIERNERRATLSAFKVGDRGGGPRYRRPGLQGGSHRAVFFVQMFDRMLTTPLARVFHFFFILWRPAPLHSTTQGRESLPRPAQISPRCYS